MEQADSVKWAQVEKILQKAEKTELIDLIRELYGHSVGDRMLINSRYLGESAKKKMNKMLEEYRKIIKEVLSTENVSGKIRYSTAERAISDYSNSSGDLVGTLDLMLTYVEGGVQFARVYGVIDDEFYDNIEGMLERFCEQLITEEGQKYYHFFRERLLKVDVGLENVGWGFEEAIYDLVSDIKDFFDEEQSDS